MSEESSKGWLGESRLLVILSKLNLAVTSCCIPGWVTCTPAPPTWVLAWGPLSTLTCPAGPRRALLHWRPGAKNWLFNPVVPGESLVAKLVWPMIFPTNTDWATLKFNWFKPWLTVWIPFTLKIWPFKRNTALNNLILPSKLGCLIHFVPPPYLHIFLIPRWKLIIE